MNLEKDEPAAFEVVNPDGESEVLLIADHASNRIPRCLDGLGLNADALASHIAWDAGTEMVARHLSSLLDAPLVLSNYSRLVIDCNRAPDSPQSILVSSDGIAIPVNRTLDNAQIASRRRQLFEPYHLAIKRVLDERKPSIRAVLSLHSFTPMLQDQHRPWSIGVCYGRDRRLAHVMLPILAGMGIGPIGDNEPYSIEDGIDYSLPFHAASRGLPHVMLEIRRDKIEDGTDAVTMAEWLGKAWQVIGPF